MEKPIMGIEKALSAFIVAAVGLAAQLAPLFGVEISPDTQKVIVSASLSLMPVIVWAVPNSLKGFK